MASFSNGDKVVITHKDDGDINGVVTNTKDSDVISWVWVKCDKKDGHSWSESTQKLMPEQVKNAS